MNGVDVKRIFDAKKTYRGFLSNTKLNDLFRESLTLCIEDAYSNLQEQAAYDEIIKNIKVNQIFSVNSNRIYVSPLDIVNVTHPSAFVLTTALPHNMKIGDSFTIENVAGFTTPINATQVVTSVPSSTSVGFTATFTGGTYTATTGQVTAHSLGGIPKMIDDYYQLLAVKTRYVRNIDIEVTAITNTAPVTYTVNKRSNNIKTGELLTISGILGNTNANGNLYVKKITSTKFATYYDKDLTIPVSGNGEYLGQAKLQRAFYKYATAVSSQTKISEYEVATITKPMVERGNNQLIFYPSDYTCEQITVDYLSTDLTFIDCTNTTIDLTDSYSEGFLYVVINRAVQLFADRFSDQGLQQNSLLEQQQTKVN